MTAVTRLGHNERTRATGSFEMKPGTRFDHYEVLSPIGRGGMGEVWKARDTKLGRFVAIKFIPAGWATEARALERLRSEARAASALNHPNICTIYDFREHEGQPLIVMEFMKGQTLRERLGSGPLKTQEVVDIGIQVADALATAHGRGIIHRDIKPDNIFLTEDGLLKVLDFGLAKLLPQSHGLDTTNTGTSGARTDFSSGAGTISFMSPEQATGEELDGRTDLFSLGVVLYICATGHLPFAGKTAAVVLSSILNRAPVAPVALNPEIPLRFQEVIYNCLEKDRELRYQSASDLRVELKRVKRDLEFARQLRTREVTRDESGIDVSRTNWTGVTPALRLPSAPAAGRNPWIARMGVAAAVLAAIAVAAFYLSQRSTGPLDAPLDPATLEPAALETTAFLESRLDLARRSLQEGDYRAAAAHAEEALSEAAGDAEAAAILDEAQGALARFDEAVADARRWLAAGNTARAQEAFEAARGIDPAAPVVSELSSELVRQLNAETRRLAEQAAAAVELPPAATPPPPAPESPTAPVLEPPPQLTGEQPDPAETPTPEPEAPSPGPAVTPPPEEPAISPEPSENAVRPAEPEAAAPRLPEPEPAPEAPGPTVESDAGASSDGEAETDIREVIDLYVRAIETQNIDLYRQVKPNLSVDEARSIAASFRDAPSERVEITGYEITRLAGDRATVRLGRRDTIVAGGRRETRDDQQTIELARREGRWVIDAVN